MKKTKITFNISEEVAQMLETRVPKRKRNAFIEEAINLRFGMIEQEKFLRELVVTNKARNEELDKIEEELEPEDAILQSDEPLDEDEILELDDLI
ncbi:MAG TPA: hypothetical protein VGA85_00530 [Dehalococcoidales bacterium]